MIVFCIFMSSYLLVWCMVFDRWPKISRKIRVATFRRGAEYVVLYKVEAEYVIVVGGGRLR